MTYLMVVRVPADAPTTGRWEDTEPEPAGWDGWAQLPGDNAGTSDDWLRLVFTEGYAPTSGAAIRRDLSAEAIRLASQLAALLPGQSEVHGLLALILLHDSRRTARVTTDGALVPLKEQVRTEWNEARSEQGLAVLDAGLRVAPSPPRRARPCGGRRHGVRTGRRARGIGRSRRAAQAVAPAITSGAT